MLSCRRARRCASVAASVACVRGRHLQVFLYLKARSRACGNGQISHAFHNEEVADLGPSWNSQQEMTHRRLQRDLAEISAADVFSIPKLNHLLAACALEQYWPAQEHIEALGRSFARTLNEKKPDASPQHRMDVLDMMLETMRVLAAFLREDGHQKASAWRDRSFHMGEKVSKKASRVSMADATETSFANAADMTANVGQQTAVALAIQGRRKTKTSLLRPLIDPILIAAEAHISAMPSANCPRGAAAGKLVIALSRMRLQAQACDIDSDVPTQTYQRAASIMSEAEDRPCTRDWSLALNAFARVNFAGVDTASTSRLLDNQFRTLEAESLEAWPAFDLALLCNALHKLVRQMSGAHDKCLTLALHRFLGRLASEALPHMAQDCGPQDVAHFAASLASVPFGSNYAAARSGLRKLLEPISETEQQLRLRHRRLVDGLAMEGLCAVLGACVRLAIFDRSSASLVQAALRRVQRSSPRFQTAHLSHLCQSLSLWLPSHRTELEHGILSQEVMKVMRCSLCPAITSCAPRFQEPKHIAFTTAALALLGNQTNSDTWMTAAEAAEALAGELLRAQLCPGARLQWSNWPGRSLSQLSEALSSLLRAEVQDGTCLNVAAVLDSLSSYLLPSEDDVTAPLLALRLADAVRISKALCLSPSGVALCQAVTSAFLTAPQEELNVRDIALLLSARQRLELRDSETWGTLLWQLHRLLFNADGVTLHWDMTAAATSLDALHRLGCLQVLSQGVLQEEEKEGVHQAHQALLCICCSSMQLLRLFHTNLDSAKQLGGSSPSARHTRSLLNLLHVLLRVVDTMTLPWAWHMATLEHIAFAACSHCSFFLPEAAWPTQAHKQWLAYVHLLCKLAAQPELAFTPWAARLKRHIAVLPGPAQPFALEASFAVSVLVAFASAGFDLTDLGPSAPSSLVACMQTFGNPQSARELQGGDIALLLPALAASSSPTAFLDVCNTTPTSCSRGTRALAMTLLGQDPSNSLLEASPTGFDSTSADQRQLFLALLSLRFGLAGPTGLHTLQLASLRCLAQFSLEPGGLAGNLRSHTRLQLVNEVWEATRACSEVAADMGYGRGGNIALLIEDDCLNHRF
eukprot:TRINITY_DN27087_c0_g1_i1.p1 TRINITY_DN27087_c0_g1~~TRINITY_DN27087_c0_g1_i1.p1  ORF type:complete len:1094 (+),score=180.47 TRINITY_DN27087_c0_g1_i1:62-3343(+)